MNTKSLLASLAVLTLSFNVFAVDVQEEPKLITTTQIALNQQDSPASHLANQIVNSHTIPQASSEQPSEFITAFSVCLIIIVYSIYGFMANAKNIEN